MCIWNIVWISTFCLDQSIVFEEHRSKSFGAHLRHYYTFQNLHIFYTWLDLHISNTFNLCNLSLHISYTFPTHLSPRRAEVLKELYYFLR